jgi:HAE1 family hydrophobic/amphiphilic exporter-1
VSPAELSVKRPIFISCIVILTIALGALGLKKIPVDLFPDVTLPTVVVYTTYPGSGPEEVENEISKILEESLSSVSGISKLSSTNREGVSVVIAEFNLGVDIKYAEQKVRAQVENTLRRLPDDIDPPSVRTVSPSDAPIMQIALSSTLPAGKLYDLAEDLIKPQFEQVNQIGEVRILGGRKREVHIELDRSRLNASNLSATQVAAALSSAGRNVPSGKTDSANSEHSYRTVGEFPTIDSIKNGLVRAVFTGFPTTVANLGRVNDTLTDENSRTYLNGKPALLFEVYRQSGSNTVKVADDVRDRMDKVNALLKTRKIDGTMSIANDRSRVIRNNVFDVYESIIIGTILTVLVVYFFLGSLRSTLITGLALPNSLLGAFIFMNLFGFSVNIMSLLALSLVVGLLVDDAIVVRENIFRKMEEGMTAMKAAVAGTNEVQLAVVATTFAVLAVFGPIGNLEGVVGQYFKQFGLTVCFAIMISLYDALTVAPMLSAYFGGSVHPPAPTTAFGRWNRAALKGFDRFQTLLENFYQNTLQPAVRRPWIALLAGVGVLVFSVLLAKRVPVTFLPPQDNGEFTVNFDLPPGTSLDATNETGHRIDARIRKNPQVAYTIFTAGNSNGASEQGSFYVRLVETKLRAENTTEMKQIVRDQLAKFDGPAGIPSPRIKVSDADASGQNQRAFNLNITGADLIQVRAYSEQVLAKLRTNAGLKDVDTSYRDGKPESRIELRPEASKMAGVTASAVGAELRTQVEGTLAGIFREKGRDYDIRVRVAPEQRDLKQNLDRVFVPTTNNRLVPLRAVADLKQAVQPASILRENRSRYIQISADIAPDGPGLGGAMREATQLLQQDMPPPAGIGFQFVGQAERFAELMRNILTALGLGVLFIYLVLASLYESFITPFTIMLVIPLAACGAFVSLFVFNSTFDLYSMIGCVMLMGLATKNSILLVDATEQLRREGLERYDALIKAGRTRLRPILMTSFAMIAGMVPVAIGLNEASKGRTSLGIVVIGGTVSSTLLTLYIIPAAYVYVDLFQNWFFRIFNRYVRGQKEAY